MDKVEKFRNAKYIFLVGIGGSNLAAKALWDAMTLQGTETHKKMFFLESPDLREYEAIRDFVQRELAVPEDIVLIAVSKSGQTEETLAAFHQSFEMLSEKFGSPITERTLIISSPGSPLWKLAESKALEKIEWQEGVGGRFSAFTVAHTVPLSLSGLDTDKLVAGGEAAEVEAAEALAKDIFASFKADMDILDFFFFNSELETLGKWCRQLIAESLGKKNKSGEPVGLTPTVSLGPSDLHSTLQLSLGGPKKRFTVFLRSAKEIEGTVNASAYHNAVEAYKAAGLPLYEYSMPEINEYEIGKFMALMMAVTLELAELLEVNPYDQPAVEEYKKNLHS